MGIPPRGSHRWKSRLMRVSSTLTTRQVTIGKWRLNPPRRKLMSPGNHPPPAPRRGPSHQTKAPSAAIESPATTRSFPNPCTPKPCPRSSPGATVHPPAGPRLETPRVDSKGCGHRLPPPCSRGTGPGSDGVVTVTLSRNHSKGSTKPAKRSDSPRQSPLTGQFEPHKPAEIPFAPSESGPSWTPLPHHSG